MFGRAMIALALGAGVLLGSATRATAQTSTPAAAPRESSLRTVTYKVADLVVPIDDAGEARRPMREGELMRLIRVTVAPKSWTENGGHATMDYQSLGMGLVIKQTAAEHEKIRDILRDLRRLLDLEVSVEMRLVSLAEGSKVDGFQEGRVLSDLQMFQLLESAQGDRSLNIMQAPKITVFDGQKAKLSVLDYQFYVTGVKVVGEKDNLVAKPEVTSVPLGFSFSVRPVVSSDRTQVSMSLGVYLANLDGPTAKTLVDAPAGDGKRQSIRIELPKVSKIELEKTLKVADGATTIVRLGRKTTETRREGPPILNKIPYLGRLYANASYGPEATDLFLLVTPRIIVHEEEEELFQAQK